MTRRIVITGGGTGIGRAIARRLAPGTDLVLIGRRQGVLDDTAAALDEAASVSTIAADLTDPAAVQRCADDLRLGAPVDALVLNAGGNYGVGAADDLASVAEAWRADFDGNVLTTVLLTEALLEHLARPGRIVAMSSIAALRGSGSYGGAKAAVNAWVLSMATQLAAEQITVNAVAPGFVPETEFWQPRIEADPSIWESRTRPIPMNRPGTPAEIAEAVAYLVSEQAGWTTGQILQVNGGTLLGRG